MGRDGSGGGALKSARWFEGDDVPAFVHRTALRAEGFATADFEGRPVVGICNSWSELINCNVHFRALANSVRRGVLQAGGLPLEFPTMALGEQLMKPTTMLYRNLMAMDVEESIRSYPLDAVVLVAGCDKTVPAQLLGAASADVPAIMLTGGPATPGVFRGREIGVGTDLWEYTDDLRAGRMSREEYDQLEAASGPSAGHCPEMGTASTMAAVVEGLGMTLPGAAAAPAVDARRYQVAAAVGRRAVELASEVVRPSQILTPAAFDNAIAVLLAAGGSTNAVIHLLALAGRCGVELDLDRFDQLSRRVPLLADVRPSGQHLVEQLFHAGGVPALMKELEPLLEREALTVTGKTVGGNLADVQRSSDRSVIATLEQPVKPPEGLVVVRGSLAPGGAVIKASAADPDLLVHRGPAVVFDGIDDVIARIDDPELEVSADSVLVLRGCGPVGAPGMPEWGAVPIPQKLLEQGVRDMVRVSDARMSGTAYGAVALHVAPEGVLAGPLAAVRSGDLISLDVPNRRLDLEVPAAEIETRLAGWTPPPRRFERGYGALFLDHVTQADEGCDFDFLRGRSADPADEPYGVLHGMIGGW
ncbi:MAG: dihydroxy-acid dehydratase [Actinobacteria bacterium]|nr:dihydroxy-acid dehydratase [Actinomycetota bacterium]